MKYIRNVNKNSLRNHHHIYNREYVATLPDVRADTVADAIKNIQKALTARILKRLDDGQPLVEVARKMKAIEGMQP